MCKKDNSNDRFWTIGPVHVYFQDTDVGFEVHHRTGRMAWNRTPYVAQEAFNEPAGLGHKQLF